MIVRKATPEDAAGIAMVHLTTWKTTYDRFVEPGYFNTLKEEDFEKRCRESLEDGALVVVAEVSGKIVGFAAGGEMRGEHKSLFDAEVFAIYVLKETQQSGAGRLMVRKLVEEFKLRGWKSMGIWVFSESPSRHFYEALGGRPAATSELEFGGKTSATTCYGWQSLSTL